YKSVQEQTGLYAGKGGFQIDVGNHTQLDGSVIASTAEADKNRLSTGTLGWSSLDNKADYKSQQQSVSISSGSDGSGKFISNMPSGMLVAYNHGDSASGTTGSAISNGTLEIRDPANQQQDLASLSRDVEHANGSISPIFDKEKEQNRLKQVQLIAEIGTQAMDIVRTQGEINATDAAKEELARNGISNPTKEQIEESAIYQQKMSQYGTGSQLQRAAQAVTAALQGLAGGDIGAALAGASAPYLANTIKQLTEGDREVQLMAHAVLGALVAQAQGNSAIAGAAGAATGEAMASVIAKQLYGKNTDDLSESEKQAVVALSSLAGGLAGGVLDGSAGGAVAGAKGGQNAVENNEFGGRLYVDHLFEAYVQSGGCGGATRQQCRQHYENEQLANGGLETAATFALLPVAIVGAAATPAILAAARAAAVACTTNPLLCVNEATIAVAEMGIGEALPAGVAGTVGAKLTLEQATKIRVAQEVERQTGQKLSADAVETILAGGRAKTTGQGYVDILSPEAKQHILYGDKPGSGGHMWPGQEGKTVFPEGWSADKIVHEIGDVVTSPETKWYAQTGTGGIYTAKGDPAKWVAYEVRDGVRMRIVYQPATGKVITAFPDDAPVPPYKPIK
ncbi:filamentous hemagglutinin, partial [Pseudomonas citronellolis]|uniref:VENN motif pre-toxin domain-containing protein n=1 Tax=Pseudomonas citronellolis TaxID=53408 RepID=UPI002646D743